MDGKWVDGDGWMVNGWMVMGGDVGLVENGWLKDSG